MSLKLLKGTIDEVDQSVQITWVHPRVLDKNQLELMNAQVQNWSERYDIIFTRYRKVY